MNTSNMHKPYLYRILSIVMTVIMTLSLAMSCCMTVFGSSDVNTDTDEDRPDGEYTFTGDGDWHGYESYLDFDLQNSSISGRYYMMTLPEDGRLQIQVSVDKETFLEARVNYYEDDYYYEQIWKVGSAQQAETLDVTSDMLAAGTHRVNFNYRRSGGDILPYWPPGKKNFYHKVTFKTLSADEKAAFSVMKDVKKLSDEMLVNSSQILDHESAVVSARASYDALTDTQKALVSPVTLNEIESWESSLESAKKAEEEAAKQKEENSDSSQADTDDSTQPAAPSYDYDQDSQSGDTSYDYDQDAQEESQNEAARVKAKARKTKGLKAKARKKGRIELSWKKTSGVSGYQIYRSTKKTKGFKRVATIKKAGTKKWTDKKTKAEKTYYYKIRPYTTIAGKKVTGKWSAVKRVKAKK